MILRITSKCYSYPTLVALWWSLESTVSATPTQHLYLSLCVLYRIQQWILKNGQAGCHLVVTKLKILIEHISSWPSTSCCFYTFSHSMWFIETRPIISVPAPGYWTTLESEREVYLKVVSRQNGPKACNITHPCTHGQTMSYVYHLLFSKVSSPLLDHIQKVLFLFC